MTNEQLTQFDYLLNAFEHASQADFPAAHGYRAKREALFAYVRGLEAENTRITECGRAHIRRAAAFEAERDQLRAEVEALRRGEFICQACGLRKDADAAGPVPF